MVNSKITNWVQGIAQDTQDGITYLRSVGVEIVDNATLGEVISKMQLIPTATPPSGGNTPSDNPRDYFDPLIKWGGKDLLDLWENDTRKNDFGFQMFVVINGAFDTQDFKEGVTTVAQRNALAFETSDGVYYPPSTDVTCIHNWDTSQDIYDSNGSPVRYVKVYSNVSITGTNTPYFNNTIRYCKYELQNTNGATLFYQKHSLEWFECERLTSISISGSTTIALSHNYSLTYINLPALTSISIGGSGSGTIIALSYNYKIEKIDTPILQSAINFQNNNYSQNIFTLPDTVSSYAITLTNNHALTKMIIPTGWTRNIAIRQSTQMGREALVEVIMNFADRTGQTALIFNIGAINRSKLTEEDLLLATNKNITIS